MRGKWRTVVAIWVLSIVYASTGLPTVGDAVSWLRGERERAPQINAVEPVMPPEGRAMPKYVRVWDHDTNQPGGYVDVGDPDAVVDGATTIHVLK